MFDIHRVELDWGGRKLTLETGKIARQAHGAVVATYGESKLLATVVAAMESKEGVDFLPLTVDYQEKTYAAGRIPGGYFKREGRPTEKETLVSRLIDRPIRPLFVNDEYVLNPTLDEMVETQLDLVVAGTADAVLMVESEAKELNEDIMLGAVMFGHRHFQPVIKAIIELAEKAAKEPREVAVVDESVLEKEILGLIEQDLRAAYAIPVKQDRYAAVGKAKEKVMAHYFPEGEEPKYDKLRIAGVFKELEAKIVRWNILDTGKLAWRAIHPVLPPHHEFPYTVRVVSEITESNGSSSMASVCGASLALMDAGVPLKRPTAGIAMGLILEGSRFAVLSDILGDEDHLGDMDFKVAGTDQGITSLQMDIKIEGITEEIMKVALGQAKDGRIHILGEMSKALTNARAELGEYAPRIETFKSATDKIREVIGTGGKVIREIVEKTGAKVNIDDDGTVKVASADGESIKAAIKWIKSIASDPELNAIYDGTVVKVMEFGAFVNFFGAKDGLVHISQLASNRVQKTSDVVKEGDKVKVKLLGFDDRGKTRLSMKVVDQVTGEDLEAKQKAVEAPRE